MSFIASTSRVLPQFQLPRLGSIRHVSGSHRYVKGKPKAAKTPLLRSPHHPKLPLPSSGTSQPHPPDLTTSFTPTTSSVQLDTAGLVLHHSPPASAPTFTTGLVPPFLSWLGGESVKLTGEEDAPLLRERRDAKGDVVGGWSEELISDMREMRAKGMSRVHIAKALSVPREHSIFIQRVAPLSPEQVKQKEMELEQRKTTWGYRKRLARASKVKRKEFW